MSKHTKSRILTISLFVAILAMIGLFIVGCQSGATPAGSAVLTTQPTTAPTQAQNIANVLHGAQGVAEAVATVAPFVPGWGTAVAAGAIAAAAGLGLGYKLFSDTTQPSGLAGTAQVAPLASQNGTVGVVAKEVAAIAGAVAKTA